MRCGEVPSAGDVEQALDAVEVEEERVTAGPGEERDGIRLGDDWRCPAGDFDRLEDPLADRLSRLGFAVVGQEDVDGLAAVDRLGEDEAERDVVAQIAVVVDRQPVDRTGMQRIGIRIGVQDQHCVIRVGR